MPALIVMFNLKDGVSEADYEAWAKAADLPTVRGHKGVDGFDLFRANNLFRTENAAPYRYVEVIQINDLDQFNLDVATDVQKPISEKFGEIADSPVAMLCDKISD
ncbi:MAG: REDY-like protein HapK [Rhodospirillaceae bacterium]|mgnify:CR=1 FL=1|jgi:hypothetical protein|nr:REDY-like protein HapK [Rhodospirillaceae bacterium]MBT5241292.1 REDY-like protein HapK [Rhodospirillaceae bacterium]MBT5565073.1 REDY-like protein HapK [Rhodospirillaceae bacterium]MBT6088095.1 REDY-like protein HapK [Rhodospirillaceae bacterium]MBT6961969.1 REDY-like protein HapK [Rhodospirillaceae bacterium]